MADDLEEQYLLRVQDRELAARLARVLQEDAAARPADADISLEFDVDGQPGRFTVGGETFPAHLLNLPTIVESYKTYDDIHLVKSSDIGQMLLVTEQGVAPPPNAEARHGVTPPMRDARARHFRPRPDVSPALVAKTEQDLLAILGGGAPDGVEYIDAEEEYVVDEQGRGSWQPARPLAKPAPKAPRQKKERKPPGPRSKKAKAAKEAADAAGAGPSAKAAGSVQPAAAPAAAPVLDQAAPEEI